MTVGIEKGVSCNFCNRGKIVPSGDARLFYPYDFVYTIERTTGSSIKCTICEDCIRELYNKTVKKDGDS